MMTIQIKYQREIDRLEKELQSLKKQLLLKQDRNISGKKQRTIKVCFEKKLFQYLIHLYLLEITY